MSDSPEPAPHPGFGKRPFVLKHFNGETRATFTDANPAWWCWKGMDALSRGYFHFEDANGKRIDLHDQPRRPGHAYALLAASGRADATPKATDERG